jgi:hypothetical protein
MMSLFLYLLPLSFLAISVLRVVIGTIALSFSIKKIRSGGKVNTLSGVIFALSSILFIAGIFTQGVAIAMSILSLFEFYLAIANKKPCDSKMLWILMSIVSISFLFFGAGAWGFDLPL